MIGRCWQASFACMLASPKILKQSMWLRSTLVPRDVRHARKLSYLWKLMLFSTSNAPINIMPHYPSWGNIWGTQGNLTQF